MLAWLGGRRRLLEGSRLKGSSSHGSASSLDGGKQQQQRQEPQGAGLSVKRPRSAAPEGKASTRRNRPANTASVDIMMFGVTEAPVLASSGSVERAANSNSARLPCNSCAARTSMQLQQGLAAAGEAQCGQEKRQKQQPCELSAQAEAAPHSGAAASAEPAAVPLDLLLIGAATRSSQQQLA